MNQKLKTGTFLAIKTQDEFNELARITKAFKEDSLLIYEEYTAYLDYDGAIEGAIHVVPMEDFLNENPNMNIKPRKFKSWVRSLK